MLQNTQCVVYGQDAIYALRGDEGTVEWRTDLDNNVPELSPCPRCVNRPQCMADGGGKVDITGCPVAEGWRDAQAAYEAAIQPR